MAKHRLSAPPEHWPGAIRTGFDGLSLTPAQRKRLGAALGRWVLLAEDPFDPTPEAVAAVTAQIPAKQRKAVTTSLRQVLSTLFPEHGPALYASNKIARTRTKRYKGDRSRLAAHISRHLPRLPPEWRVIAEPLLRVDPDGLSDGVLVSAWSRSTIERRLEALGRYFDKCRKADIALDVNAAGIRVMLRDMQNAKNRPATAQIELYAILSLARVLYRDHDWRWLSITHGKIKKIAEASPSRNAGRAIAIDELREFGLGLFSEAERVFDAAANFRDYVKAHTLARTGLSIVLLSEAPTRIGSLASVELQDDLLETLASLRVEACETKTDEAELRVFSREAIRCMIAYIDRHRATFAHPASRSLFIGVDGNPVVGATLSANIGRFTEERLQKRVTAHVFRHAAGNFILAEAPEEAGLASVILQHRSRDVTEGYARNAGQVKAGRAHARATQRAAENLGADTKVMKSKKRRLSARGRRKSR